MSIELRDGTILGTWGGENCILRLVRKTGVSRPWWVIVEYHSGTGRVDVWKEADGMTPQEAAINAMMHLHYSLNPVNPTPEGKWALDEVLRIRAEKEAEEMRRRLLEEEERRRRMERQEYLVKDLDARIKMLKWIKGQDGVYCCGLVVKKTDFGGWMVAHARSGLYIQDRFRRKKDAMRVVAYLVSLPVDWEADEKTVQHQALRCEGGTKEIMRQIAEIADLP